MPSKYFEFLEKTGKLPKEEPEEESFDIEGLNFLPEELPPEEEFASPGEDPKDHEVDFSNALKMRALRARRGLK